MRRLSILVLGLLLLACQPIAGSPTPATEGPTPTTDSETDMTDSEFTKLTYIAQGGQPTVNARLEIDAAGQATLFSGSSWSVPPLLRNTVGNFGAALPAETFAALKAQIADAGVLDLARQERATSPDPTTRYLTIEQGSESYQFSLLDTSDEPALADLEQQLVDIMTELLSEPVRALAVDLFLDESDAGLVPTVDLSQLGPEPLPLLLLEPDDANYFLRISLVLEKETPVSGADPIWLPNRTIDLSREQVEAFVTEGVFPAGVHEMAPGAVYSLTLAPIQLPNDGATYALRPRVVFWFPGEGAARQMITVETDRILLTEE